MRKLVQTMTAALLAATALAGPAWADIRSALLAQ